MNDLQLSIMQIISQHSKECDHPISLSEIITKLDDENIPRETVKYSMRALVKAGYIRKSVERLKLKSYVRLRSV